VLGYLNSAPSGLAYLLALAHLQALLPGAYAPGFILAPLRG
jgi:hypothetical protein